MSELLEGLNNKQKEAVLKTDGPVLILAGAGSGKTTVLVNRIAYLIDELGIRPYRILSITFTNKAAKEMKDRIEKKVGDMANEMWTGTFHSICVRILRRAIDKIGYDNSFVIYDTADSKTVMKECLKELNIDEKNFPIRYVLSCISKAKDDLMDAATYEMVNKADFRLSTVAELYKLYQKKLKKNNALDFDDIIFNTIKVLSENPELLEKYQHRFQYIMVDEYQDTNNSQYMLISMLAQGYRNLCVVGDDDQSIYKFRGANIRNILDFEREFSDAVVIKLEQNYRSTQTILNAANTVISNNVGRKGKDLWTDNQEGNKVRVYTAYNEHDEANYIASEINRLIDEQHMKYSDIAILYRTNAQSRVLEEMLIRQAVPYKILAGLRFYDRKEIKDIIAYLRVVHNPGDDVSLKRIINEPKRSIGATTVEKLQTLANELETSIFAVIANPETVQIFSRASAKLSGFVNMINSFIIAADGLELSKLVETIIHESGYMAMLKAENTVESQTRIENIKEFMSVVADHQNNTEDATLTTFLESVSLMSEIDSYDEEQDSVVLMTIHSAKGLEFPVVFLAGMEDGLFPSMRSIENREDLEEERRLCYVAITRAKQDLYITNTEERMLYGMTNHSRPSRFLKEISEEYLEASASRTPKRTIGEKIISGAGIQKTAQANHIYRKPELVEPLPEAIHFKPGDMVEHKKFGRGMIISVQQFGKDAKLEIAFDSVGTKHLMAVFAKLKKL